MQRRKQKIIWRVVVSILILFYVTCYIGYDAVLNGHEGIYNYGSDVIVLSDNILRVSFLDVGQGDAILVQEGEKAMLIDAGDNEHGERVVAYLKEHGIGKLDYLLLTHPDADHIGGADDVLENLEVSQVLMTEVPNDTKSYRDVLWEFAAEESLIRQPEIGEVYTLEKARFKILAPEKEYLDENDCNDASIGIKLTYGDNSFLMCGDAEEKSESAMVKRFGKELECDVLKCNHHGSYTATSEAFLNAADPSWAVISCGKDNSYGHPHKAVLERLYEADVQVYRTDELGTIIVESDGENLRFGQEHNEILQNENKSNEERINKDRTSHNRDTRSFNDAVICF